MPTESPQIHKLMAEILAELPAIGKSGRAPANMGGYAFRGIEDVLNELNPILSAKGVYFTPDVLERIESTRPTNNKTMYCVSLRVEYTFYAPDGSFVTASTWGEGTDMGDKATQKALTAAMKYMLFEVFAINTQDQAMDDVERHDTPASELSPKEVRKQAWGDKALPDLWETWDEMDAAHQKFTDGLATLPPEQKDAVTAFVKEKQFPWPFSVTQLQKVLEHIKGLKGAPEESEAAKEGFAADEQQAVPA